MPTRKIFVSHSSRKDQTGDLTEAARDFLIEVCDALADDDRYRILIDQGDDQGRPDRIPPGADWEQLLNEWMAECHGAVLLLNQQALDSPWVQKEAIILIWRRATEPDFPVIPVLLDGLRPEELDAHPLFKVISAGRLQALAADDAASITQRVRVELDRLFDARISASGGGERTEPTPFERLERVILQRLSGAVSKTVNEICQNLDVEAKLANLYRPQYDRAEEMLARFIIRNYTNAVQCAQEVLEYIGDELDRESARKIVERVRPLWVDQTSAACLPLAAAAAHSERAAPVLAFKAKFPWIYTAQCYFDKAYSVPGSAEWVCVDHTANRKDDIERALLNKFNAQKWGDDIAGNDLKNAKQPVFALIPIQFGFNENLLGGDTELQEIRRRYPNVIFILANDRDESDSAPLRAEVTPVKPELNPVVEDAQFRAYRNADRWVDNLS